MTDEREPSGAQKQLGGFAPELVRLTDDVLFGQVWPRPVAERLSTTTDPKGH